MPFPYIHETKEITESLRQSVDGDFMSLSDGYTHYELNGDKDANTVILVNGFSAPYFIWDPTFQALIEAGYRILRYDLFGRGFSDRPKARYDIHLFVRQLTELLDSLNIRDPINLFGLSMGGPITATFTTRHPERVKKLALFDPAGARAVQLSQTLKSGLTLGLSGLNFLLFGKQVLLTSIANDFYEPQNLKPFLARYGVQMQYRGFKRAILSTLRNRMLGDFSKTYRQIGTQPERPVLLIWGREDKTVPYENSQEVVASIPHAAFHTIENSGHIPHYENAEEVNPILLDFLKG